MNIDLNLLKGFKKLLKKKLGKNNILSMNAHVLKNKLQKVKLKKARDSKG